MRVAVLLFGAWVSACDSATVAGVPEAEHYVRGANEPMYREIFRVGELGKAKGAALQATIGTRVSRPHYFGMIVSTSQPLSSERSRLPDAKISVRIRSASGQEISSFTFPLRQLTQQSTGSVPNVHPEFPGPYQTFAYLDQWPEAAWNLEKGGTYVVTVKTEEAIELPTGMRLFAVVLLPGWKQMSMEIINKPR